MSDGTPITFVPPKTKGLKRVYKATIYSMEGLGSAIAHESAFRMELILMATLGPLVVVMDIETSYKVMVLMAMGNVLVAELLNSAIEAVVDRMCKGYDPLAKRAKDMGSAAVFVALIFAGMAWAAALWARWG